MFSIAGSWWHGILLHPTRGRHSERVHGSTRQWRLNPTQFTAHVRSMWSLEQGKWMYVWRETSQVLFHYDLSVWQCLVLTYLNIWKNVARLSKCQNFDVSRPSIQKFAFIYTFAWMVFYFWYIKLQILNWKELVGFICFHPGLPVVLRHSIKLWALP
jgi:hypothetical protein